MCVAESFLGMRNAPRGNNITPNVENIIQSICMPPAPKRFLRSGKRCVIWVLLFVPSVEKFYFGEEICFSVSGLQQATRKHAECTLIRNSFTLFKTE